MEREYQEKISHLNDLVQLARIDGHESLLETNFINSVADRLGIERNDLEDIKNDAVPVEFVPPRFEYQVIPQFHRLVLLMGIDRMIYREEVNFLTDLGLRMGLNLHAVREVLEKMIYYPNNIIPAEEMESIFKKYYN